MKKIITIVIVIAFAVNSAGQGYLSRTKLNNALRSIATYNFGKGAIRAFEPEATKLGVSYSYVWKPTTLCLEITQRCDNPTPCRICAANATHGAQARLTVQQIKRRLMEAKAAGIKYLSITGGEPTVEEKVLFSAVEEAEKIGIEFVYFNTNCYRWGRSVGFAKKKLRKLAEAKVFSWDKTHATVCISISNEHQKGIPVTRVANFIEAYQATFPGTKLEAIGLRMKEEDKAVASLITE